MHKMMYYLCFVVLLLGSFQNTKSEYIASVVEHHFINYSTPNITIEENIKSYIEEIEIAKNRGSQIIVYPEYGLTGLVVDPTDYAIEIPDVKETTFSNYFLRKLSSAALEHQIYLVVNLLEKEKNEQNDTLYYNTNVVFDKQGKLAAKYRKINLYYEPNLTPGNETVTFTTDFNVTFGIFTCADIIYYHPSQSILVNSSLSDIIFPTAWTSYLPFYAALTVQSGYATANKVNLLASNFNNPKLGMGGSGIYSKDGSILRKYLAGSSSTMQFFRQRLFQTLTVQSGYATANKVNLLASNFNNPKLGMGGSGIYSKDGSILRKYLAGSSSTMQLTATLDTAISDVPTLNVVFGFNILKNESSDELDNFTINYDFAYDKFSFKPVKFDQQNVSEEICDGSFCCHFDISLNETNVTEVYKLMAFDGKLKIGNVFEHIKLCDLVYCINDDINTCGKKPNTTLTTKFTKIDVHGKFKRDYHDFYRPLTLRGDLQPITNITYNEFPSGRLTKIHLNTTKTESNVLVFGIYGRGSSSTLTVNIVLVLLLIFSQKFF